MIEGSRDFVYPDMKAYKKAYREIYNHLRDTDDMDKYHILGTAAGIQPLNAIGGVISTATISGVSYKIHTYDVVGTFSFDAAL